MTASVPLAGCFGGGGRPLPKSPPGETLIPDERRLADLAKASAEATTPEARLALGADALRASGVGPIADAHVPGPGGQFIVGRDGQTLAGWVIGRVPVWKDSLVIISAPRNGVADLALIEAARMLVARGAYTQTPEHSVLVVLGDDAEAALRLWNRALVVAAIRVGPTGPDSLASQPVQRLAANASAEPLAASIYAALSRVSSPPSPYVQAR